MLRYFFLSFILISICIVGIAGLRYDDGGSKMTRPPLEIFPDMDHQAKFQPQHPTSFFADGRAARQPVTGTIPLGYNLPGRYYQLSASNRTDTGAFTDQPDYLNTGKIGDVYGDGIPLEVSEKLLARGRERFQINCQICHGAVAAGDGIVKTFGLATVASLQDERIRTMPDGQIFATITNGKNTMGAYGPQIAVEDRWAIVTYLRALQKSQNSKLAELSEAQQKELNSKK
jgi:mono/diheme cytochrome c family protein